MSEHYDFHYQPTGSGAISGQQVLEQTEDAINELGDYVNDNVGGAMDVAQQALETAQNAEQDAQTALDTANSFSSAIQSAQQDASTALSTAQTAQTTASNANNTAIQAQQDASSAVTTANNASGRVSTLSGTVTALGQRVTTAEGNIGQNTSDITALTTRVGTAEGNITTLQNDVTIAQGNASSAMATAGQVKQQAFVFRYSSTALTASSTNSNTLLDNTDNLKVGDKVIDLSGVLFSITAIDTANSTFTIGTALIDLAQDSDVVHKSGNETIGGIKTFSATPYIYNYDSTGNAPNIVFKNSKYAVGDTTNTGDQRIIYSDKNNTWAGSISSNKNIAGTQYLAFTLYTTDNNNASISSTINYYLAKNGDRFFTPYEDSLINLGATQRRWKSVCATNYYYGSNNVEFSTKFVTTDTAQTISGNKTFASNVNVYNSDNTATTPNLYLRSSKIEISSQGNTSGDQNLTYLDKNNATYAYVKGAIQSNGSAVKIRSIAKDSSDNSVINELQILAYTNGNKAIFPSYSNEVDLGISSYKWKSFNGVEPSSLSLPSDRSARIDISSYFTNTGTGNTNDYSVPANGFIFLNLLNAFAVTCYSIDGTNNVNYAQSYFRPVDGQIYILFPVRKNDVFRTLWTANGGTITVTSAYFIPCQGNV